MLKPGFVADNEAALAKLAARTGHCAAVVGFVDADRDLFNAAAVCAGGEVLGTYRKRLLPNYAVFDEARYFTPGDETDPLELYVIGGVKVGISICEDVWSPDGPLAVQAAGGAELAVNINASPYHRGKAARPRADARHPRRRRPLRARLRQPGRRPGRAGLRRLLAGVRRRGPAARPRPAVRRGPADRRRAGPAVYRQRLLDPRGRIVAACRCRSSPSATAPVAHGDPAANRGRRAARRRSPSCTRRSCSAPATTARKNGFTDVVIGLSGGIDSTLVAVIAVDALGADHVHGVSMPSRYSSDHSKTDAAAAGRPTSASTTARSRSSRRSPPTSTCSAPSFEGRPPGLTEENLQSRCRGQVLMALSNEFGWMVLTTGNKSEMAVGYFTIYGDSVGGYAVIKDVLKTEVYDAVPLRQRAGRARDRSPRRDHQAAVGRAAPRPARRPEPAAVRGARPDPRALRRGGPHRRRDRRARPRRGRRAPGHPARRRRRVQAAPDARPACG